MNRLRPGSGLLCCQGPDVEPPNWEEPVPLSAVHRSNSRSGCRRVGCQQRFRKCRRSRCGSITSHCGSYRFRSECHWHRNCASAKVPDRAKADAQRIVAGLMTVSFLLRRPQSASGVQADVYSHGGRVWGDSFLRLCEKTASTSNIEPNRSRFPESQVHHVFPGGEGRIAGYVLRLPSLDTTLNI